MRIVLDSNEYILYLNNKSLLLHKLFDHEISIYVNELIIKEVLRNITHSQRKTFYQLLFKGQINVFNEALPFSLYEKYQKLGLKKGDIIIASFCEHIKADYLLTENRHFLKSNLKATLKILTLKEFLGK